MDRPALRTLNGHHTIRTGEKTDESVGMASWATAPVAATPTMASDLKCILKNDDGRGAIVSECGTIDPSSGCLQQRGQRERARDCGEMRRIQLRS